MQTNIAGDSVNFSGIMGKEESSLGEKLGQENDGYKVGLSWFGTSKIYKTVLQMIQNIKIFLYQ